MNRCDEREIEFALHMIEQIGNCETRDARSQT